MSQLSRLVYQHIQHNPGLRANEIKKALTASATELGLRPTSVLPYIHFMVKAGIVEKYKVDNTPRYRVISPYNENAIARVQQPVSTERPQRPRRSLNDEMQTLIDCFGVNAVISSIRQVTKYKPSVSEHNDTKTDQMKLDLK